MARKLEKGFIEIYTGNGKGKSTAAFGLALRAAGRDMQVVIIQFMKTGEDYGESAALARLSPQIQRFSYGSKHWVQKGQATASDLEYAAAALERSRQALASSTVDLLILDEICNALYFELVTLEQVRALLAGKPVDMEVVLTGRNAPAELIELADYVTEMCEIKHPYQEGVGAREGIEY